MTIAADYLVGCDGAGGTVRRQLGIALDGLGPIATSVNVFFRSAEFITMQDEGWARFFRCFDDDGCWAEAIAINSEGPVAAFGVSRCDARYDRCQLFAKTRRA